MSDEDEMITLHEKPSKDKEASEKESITLRDKTPKDAQDNPMDKVAYEKDDK